MIGNGLLQDKPDGKLIVGEKERPLQHFRSLFDRPDVLRMKEPIDCYVLPRTDSHKVKLQKFF